MSSLREKLMARQAPKFIGASRNYTGGDTWQVNFWATLLGDDLVFQTSGFMTHKRIPGQPDPKTLPPTNLWGKGVKAYLLDKEEKMAPNLFKLWEADQASGELFEGDALLVVAKDDTELMERKGMVVACLRMFKAGSQLVTGVAKQDLYQGNIALTNGPSEFTGEVLPTASINFSKEDESRENPSAMFLSVDASFYEAARDRQHAWLARKTPGAKLTSPKPNYQAPAKDATPTDEDIPF